MIEYIRILLSAWRMGLRDKGATESFIQDGWRQILVHGTCHTRARVGINGNGDPCHYCWRCEVVLDYLDDPDPKGREDLPEEQVTPVDDKVIDMKKYRA